MSRHLINRLIILIFFILVGYCIASSIAYKSLLGVTCAIISLCAGIYFLYLLAKRQEEMRMELEKEKAA